MIDWPRIVIELRKWGTLREIGRVVGVCETRLVEICAGYEWTPRFDQGMKMLSLYDRVAGKAETRRAVDHFDVWAVANHQSLKQTPRGRKRLSSDRSLRIPAFLADETGSFDRLVSELEGSQG